MAAQPPSTGPANPVSNEKVDELLAMFPELTPTDVQHLMDRYQGDMMQIVDKLLQQESLTPPLSSTMTQASPQKSVVTVGNPSHSANVPPSAPTTYTPERVTQPLSQSSSSYGYPKSPWGPENGKSSNGQSFPSAFASQAQTTSTSASDLQSSYSAPISIPKNPAAALQESIPTQGASSVFSGHSPVARSISPPAFPVQSPYAPDSSESAGRPTKVATPTSTNLTQTNPGFVPSGSHPISSTPVQSPYQTIDRDQSRASQLEEHLGPRSPPSSTNDVVESISSILVSTSPKYLSSTPSRDYYGPAPGASPPRAQGNANGHLGTGRSDSSPLGNSLSASRINEERTVRLRAAEAQFQALMASMSEMEQTSQHELDVKDGRIAQLESEVKALASEKSTWVSRLEKLSGTTVQLRDQLSQQSQMIVTLEQQLEHRDAQIAQLQAKVLSFQPIEGAEQFRLAFEASLQTAIPSQGPEITRAMADFASTFQRALAASLLAPLQPK
jgi:archaellum component FlaC